MCPMSASKVAEMRLKRAEARLKAYNTAGATAVPKNQEVRLMPSVAAHELPSVLQQCGASSSLVEWAAWRTKSLTDEETQSLAQAGGITAVLGAMRAHLGETAVQEDCCGALARFASCDPVTREAVLEHGAIAALSAAMRSHPQTPELQEAAVAALAAIAVRDVPAEAVVIGSSCLAAVASAMRMHPHRLDLQRSGCSLLYYVAAGSDAGRTALVESHCIEAVAAAMRAHPKSEGLLADGCGALCSLASSNDAGVVSHVVRTRAIDHVIEAMLTCPPSLAAVQKWGCVAICSVTNAHWIGGEAAESLLSYSPSCSSERVRAVVRAMRAHPSDAVIQEQGCGALWGIASSDEVGRRAVMNDAGEVVVLAAMRAHPAQAGVQEQGCGALCAACATDGPMHAKVVQGGAIAAAVAALGRHGRALGVQRRACALLAILAAFDEAVALTVQQVGAPQLAVSAIVDHPIDPSVLRTACALLLAAWPFDLPQPDDWDDAPTGGESASASASATELAQLMGRTVEAVLASLGRILEARPRSLWFASWVRSDEVTLGGASLANTIEPAYAVLAQLVARGDCAARAHAMGSLGAVPLLTETLLAASEEGLRLPHGQELGGLLARAARGEGEVDEEMLELRMVGAAA